jgi:hypothetical protein
VVSVLGLQYRTGANDKPLQELKLPQGKSSSHSFIKSNRKVTPGRVVENNPGLKDIVYSITGGALKGQGL